MRNRNRTNVLLVEILIAVLFFMLSATVLVRVFVTARNMTVRSGVETRALAQAQNVADALYAAESPEDALAEMEFGNSHGAWTKSYGDFTIYVELSGASTGAGEMQQGSVRAFYTLRNADKARQEDEELFSLPVARYKGGKS